MPELSEHENTISKVKHFLTTEDYHRNTKNFKLFVKTISMPFLKYYFLVHKLSLMKFHEQELTPNFITLQYLYIFGLFVIIFPSYICSSMDSYSELKYMETSCQLLQLQEDITTLQKERDCIDQRIKEKKFEEKQLQRANLGFLKIVSKTKSSHNYSPEK